MPVSPPLPPPPSGDVDDNRFSLLPPFDARYTSANIDSVGDYGGNYGGDYNSRRSRLEDEDEEWVPENYLEKGKENEKKIRFSNCRLTFLEKFFSY
jgi:hypothetical protein